mgnify:CR=1 FL=1
MKIRHTFYYDIGVNKRHRFKNFYDMYTGAYRTESTPSFHKICAKLSHTRSRHSLRPVQGELSTPRRGLLANARQRFAPHCLPR